MSRRVSCPACGLNGELPAGYKAKHVRCVRCQHRFPIANPTDPEARPSTSLGFQDPLGRTRTHHPAPPSVEDYEAMVAEAEKTQPHPGPISAESIEPSWLDDDFGPGEEYPPSGGAFPVVSISTASRMVSGLPSASESAVGPLGDEPWLYAIATWHAKLAGAVGVLQFPLIGTFVLIDRTTGRYGLEPWQDWMAISLSILVLFLIPLLAGAVLVLVDAARLLRVGMPPTRRPRRSPVG